MRRLLITASSIEKAEELLNKHFYSTTYKIIDGKIMFGNPLNQNKSLIYEVKGKKHQIFTS